MFCLPHIYIYIYIVAKTRKFSKNNVLSIMELSKQFTPTSSLCSTFAVDDDGPHTGLCAYVCVCVIMRVNVT